MRCVSNLEVGHSVNVPEVEGVRIQMMPVILGDASSLAYGKYRDIFIKASNMLRQSGIGYLTIDNRTTSLGRTMRKPGWHVDGFYNGSFDGTWGPVPTQWESIRNGMIIASSKPRCEFAIGAYRSRDLTPEGGAEAVVHKMFNRVLLPEHALIKADGKTLHRTLPAETEGESRCFFRLSGPSSGDWHSCNTRNTLGVKPEGRVISSLRPGFLWESLAEKLL